VIAINSENLAVAVRPLGQPALDAELSVRLSLRGAKTGAPEPTPAKSLDDVRFYALALDDSAAPRVPASGREPQYESMANGKVAAAEHLAACASPDDLRESVLVANAATISPALNVCSFTSMTMRPWNGLDPKPSVTSRIERSRWRTRNRMAILSVSSLVAGNLSMQTSWSARHLRSSPFRVRL
jgi:hypothetical protein